jgi:hypothetical protein
MTQYSDLLTEVRALTEKIKKFDESATFRLNQKLPKDLSYLVRIDGKVYMGLFKWNEMNRFFWPTVDKAGAEEWLKMQTVFDLDAVVPDPFSQRWFPA